MRILLRFCVTVAMCVGAVHASVVFDGVSAYHHIRVVDNRGLRTLSFDGSLETRMSLADPSKGHFEYTEYFHMPFLWNPALTNVLMVGLGGGSTQRSYQKYWPQVTVETVELDPMVVKVAAQYFGFRQTPTNYVVIADGRVHLRQTKKKYDVILMDAYTKSRYGSSIPYHLATQEFFELASQHLTDQGVLAYNVIGSLQGWRADILGALYRTLKSVFPQVYLFPATDSLNVVLLATKSQEKITPIAAIQKGQELARRMRITMPTFHGRLRSLRTEAPPSFERSPVLTDDFAPVDGLLRVRP